MTTIQFKKYVKSLTIYVIHKYERTVDKKSKYKTGEHTNL